MGRPGFISFDQSGPGYGDGLWEGWAMGICELDLEISWTRLTIQCYFQIFDIVKLQGPIMQNLKIQG